MPSYNRFKFIKIVNITINIEKYSDGQENEISLLIKKVYDEFVALDYSDEGNAFFYDFIQPKNILERQKMSPTILVAKYNSKIVGMIELRDNSYISLLFVDKEFQGQGIAKRLYREALDVLIPVDLRPTRFYVHASPYSIAIYKSLGFSETDSMQEEHGIKYLPMEARITF
ncbi:MAG TPA: GNAT family N-acetyltransferase [Bacteroidales bacterium]|nr:GNAT family N-acetyltransferase [Bacteroidales bacterium]HPS71316.1 GNAT family N-acetyltransferase [Bacteroidales bacterium]